MWFDQRARSHRWAAACKHLALADPVLTPIIEKVGPCTLAPRRDYFVILCKSIFSQQISFKGAITLYNRFRDQFPNRRVTPEHALVVLTRDDALLRHCGLSRQKRGYIKDLAERFLARSIRTHRFSKMTDDEVIDELTQVKGIGRWTAEMLLIFVLNRTDVLPIDDIGLQETVRKCYGLEKRPTKAELTRMAEKWRPYRSIATWYFWRVNEK